MISDHIATHIPTPEYSGCQTYLTPFFALRVSLLSLKRFWLRDRRYRDRKEAIVRFVHHLPGRLRWQHRTLKWRFKHLEFCFECHNFYKLDCPISAMEDMRIDFAKDLKPFNCPTCLLGVMARPDSPLERMYASLFNDKIEQACATCPMYAKCLTLRSLRG